MLPAKVHSCGGGSGNPALRGGAGSDRFSAVNRSAESGSRSLRGAKGLTEGELLAHCRAQAKQLAGAASHLFRRSDSSNERGKTSRRELACGIPVSRSA